MERSADQQDEGRAEDEGRRFPWEEVPEDDGEPGLVRRNLEELGDEAAEDVRTLHAGSSIGFFGTRLPLRLLGAISIFVGVFVGVYLLTWAALGDIGLAVGLFVAAILAVIAVKLFASISSASSAA